MSEEVDELCATRSPTPSHLSTLAVQPRMGRSTAKKQAIPLSSLKRPAAPPTISSKEDQPLFLPDSGDELAPSTSMGIPPSLPEGEREPQRKKRRISTKTPLSRTLDDLWGPRQVSEVSSIPYP